MIAAFGGGGVAWAVAVKHPPSTAVIEIDLHHVLWFTRGKGWDYTFLLWPLLPRIADPDGLRERIFEGIKPGYLPHSITGRVRDGRERRGYLATAFVDPARRDDEGRAIVHRIVWFPPDGNTHEVAPADWGPQLVAAMHEPYDAVSPIVMERFLGLDHRPRIREIFVTELAQVSPRVRVEGPAVMLYLSLTAHPVNEPFAALGRWWKRWPRLAALLVWLGVALVLYLVGRILGR